MNINMTCVSAENIVATEYPGASKPMSTLKECEAPHSLDWWLTNPRSEGDWHERKRDAIRALLAIINESEIDLPQHAFPAALEFSGGEYRRPDKGQIKTLMNNGRLAARIQAGELIFQLTNHSDNEEFFTNV